MEVLLLIVLICTLSEEPIVEVEEEQVVKEVPDEAVNVEEVHAIAEALKAIGNIRG